MVDVERLLTSGGLRFPGFRLAKAGAKLDVADYTKDLSWRPQPFSGSADVQRVLAEFEDGATIVLQGLHLNWQPLAEFCRSLESELGHPAQANAYFTPRSAQGLPVHHDTHDVFSSIERKVRMFGLRDIVVEPREEADRLRRGDLIIAIQDEERRELQRLAPDTPVITAGVDFEVVPDAAGTIAGRILFVASGKTLDATC